VSLILVATAVLAAFFVTITVGGQEGLPKPGAPAYTEALHSKALPPPPPKFGGEIKQTAAESKLWWPPRIVPPKGAPNVLLVMLDDAGYGSESTFGGTIPTPTLDRLAKTGLRYTHFHSASLCSPTRAALITGRNHHSAHFGMVAEGATGYPGYDAIVKQDTTTIGTILWNNGYATSWFGKSHNVAGWLATQAGPFGQWQPNLFHNTTPIAPCEGNPSWNSQMLTHQRPGVRAIQKGGYHVSAQHERHPWASPAGIRLGCPGDGRGRAPDAHTGRSTRPVGAVQGGDQG
jgi:Sulfatase